MSSADETCESFDCIDGIRHLNYRAPFMACYTLDLLRYLERGHAYRKCGNKHSYELYLEASWNTSETMSSMDAEFYPILLHDSGVYPPETLYMAAMSKGQIRDYSLAQLVWQRLEKPYSTRCWNYIEKFGQSSIFRGNMARRSCEQQCQMFAEVDLCGCVRGIHEFQHFQPHDVCPGVLEQGKCTDVVQTPEGALRMAQCAAKCNQECKTVRYDVRLGGIQTLPTIKAGESKVIRAAVTFSFGTSVVEYYIYKPLMSLEGVAGILAGFLGVWLGTSFVETFERVFSIMCITNDQ
ncbi:uncharacterized protein LOC111259062 isoform X1 [Varroa jacobsoni]|uniref:Uncharacterized protein n=1 Tax=Varroa destructor TaxID=109461 RepID=A0A7M7JJZ3_VARDE|nr:uncharacterized protein LOC111247047 [Varroa destructor]XP_022653312.1 uncharacterized protein LOC111247047 [Varroa destructor]XP_022686478.1 uncharacterized protein LOC111259062 isoform X1 [Varroa jacobsoni]